MRRGETISGNLPSQGEVRTSQPSTHKVLSIDLLEDREAVEQTRLACLLLWRRNCGEVIVTYSREQAGSSMVRLVMLEFICMHQKKCH